MVKNEKMTCSFCGKAQSQVQRLIEGPNVNICAECVHLCNSMLNEETQSDRGQMTEELKVPRPHEILECLNQHVIGHDYVKRILSVAVYNHYKRLKQKSFLAKDDALNEVEIEKSNILLVGPTGSGKTLLARTLARLLDVPFAIVDATTLTEAGYVGEDVENILLSLIQGAEGDVSRAEMGIIYIDEIDKIGRKTENVSITRDVSGEGVQQALLKILEGTVARVPPGGGRKHPQQQYLKIDTSHILFICGGAFVGLDHIVTRRVGLQLLGFSQDGTEPEDLETVVSRSAAIEVEPEDLIRYGLIPEMVGRLPVVASLSELSEEDLVRIMLEPKNCLVKQYQKLMAMENVSLSFTDGALHELARIAIQKKTGARGLRSTVERIMTDIMFEAGKERSAGSIRITKKMIQQECFDSDVSNDTLKIAS